VLSHLAFPLNSTILYLTTFLILKGALETMVEFNKLHSIENQESTMRIRNVLIVVLLMVFCLPLVAQDQSDATKLAMYQAEKKNPTTAGLLSCCISSSGHYYADNWARGLKFTAGRAGCVVLMIALGFDEVTETDGNYTTTTLETNSMYTLFSMGNLGLAVWEIFDAVDQTKQYNKTLYKNVFGVEPPFDLGMKIVPLKDGLVLNLAANF